MKFSEFKEKHVPVGLEIFALDADDNILGKILLFEDSLSKGKFAILPVVLTNLHEQLKANQTLDKVAKYEAYFPQKT